MASLASSFCSTGGPPAPYPLLLPGHGRPRAHRGEALALERQRHARRVVVVDDDVVQVLVQLRPRPERGHGQAAGERARLGAHGVGTAGIAIAARAGEREGGGAALGVRLVERVAERVELSEDLIIGLAGLGHDDAAALDLTGGS